ncbi:head GIN domain-containing protein [Algibacter sp. 2305UL17-15]|uniref:head GIN domain-containing protein n=1 Tax=Algibacter sp. 2305UL17-15 TaxID=3231268 RepID=UPI00345A5469
MKRLSYILIVFLCAACDSENANDCFQTSGALIQQEISVASFDKILVHRDVELIIKEAPLQKVVIETGKNLLNEVRVSVENGKLVLRDDNTCNFVRDYSATKIYVSAPNITEIRSSTQYDISSDGVLTYPSLSILSENFNVPDTFNIGNFNLNIDNNVFKVVFNGISNCFISGKTNTLNVLFAAGASRFEGRDLVAQNVGVSSRSSNDIIVNPQQQITGKIMSTGNVILVNTPPIIDVEEVYKGRLIFE